VATANHAVAVSAIGLGATGLAEPLLAVVTGPAGLLGDATCNLSDVSTSTVVFLGFRLSRRPPTERYPHRLERAEDLAGRRRHDHLAQRRVRGVAEPDRSERFPATYRRKSHPRARP
jgi:hypothetical protein